MAKYKIWDKTSNIYTPVGEVLTPDVWIKRYGWIKIPSAVPIVSAGLINGAFCGELSQMKTICENQGASFEDGLSNEELLAAIEAFEDKMNTPVVSTEPTTEERIAAALEAQVMMSLPDEEV